MSSSHQPLIQHFERSRKRKLLRPDPCQAPPKRQRNCPCQQTEVSFRAKDNVLADFRQTGFLTDIEVESNDGYKFKAHKDILHTVDGLLSCTKRCQPLKEVSFERNVVEELLRYIYTGSCSIVPSNRGGLLAAANKYKLSGLLKLLGLHYVANVTLDNALEFHRVVEKNFCPSVCQRIVLFIVHNFSEVKGKEDLNTVVLKQFLRNDHLDEREIVLFHMIESWHREGTFNDGQTINLLKCIRFTNMNLRERDDVRRTDIYKTFSHHDVFQRIDRYFTDQLVIPRLQPESPRIPKSVILCIGGWEVVREDNSHPTKRIEVYDEFTERWIEGMAFYLPASRAYHGSGVIGNKLYVFGGYSPDHREGHGDQQCLRSTFFFDIDKRHWKRVAQMNDRRIYTGSCTYQGFLYALGGHNFTIGTGTRLNSMERYDPGTNTWEQLSPMRYQRSDLAVVAAEGKIFAIGGFSGQDQMSSVEIYDVETNKWSRGPPLLDPRSGHQAILVNKKIFVIGGFRTNPNSERLRTVEVLDLESYFPIWKPGKPMRCPRSNMGVTFYKGKIWVCGGYNGESPCANVESFCPEQNQWQHEVPMDNKKSALTTQVISPFEKYFYINR